MLLAFTLVLNMAAWFLRSGNHSNDAAMQHEGSILLKPVSLTDTERQQDDTGIFVLSSLTAVLGAK